MVIEGGDQIDRSLAPGSLCESKQGIFPAGETQMNPANVTVEVQQGPLAIRSGGGIVYPDKNDRGFVFFDRSDKTFRQASDNFVFFFHFIPRTGPSLPRLFSFGNAGGLIHTDVRPRPRIASDSSVERGGVRSFREVPLTHTVWSGSDLHEETYEPMFSR